MKGCLSGTACRRGRAQVGGPQLEPHRAAPLPNWITLVTLLAAAAVLAAAVLLVRALVRRVRRRRYGGGRKRYRG